MTKPILLAALALAGLVLAHSVRTAPGPAPMARLQAEENRRFAELCRRTA
ncbi:hypothetical protein [Streptomyces sp. NPDC001165]